MYKLKIRPVERIGLGISWISYWLGHLEIVWYNLATYFRRRSWNKTCDFMRAEPEKYIPKDTHYCYSGDMCPFWNRFSDLPEQSSGYCGLIQIGDWQDKGPFLLWDACKECGINIQDHNPGMIEAYNNRRYQG